MILYNTVLHVHDRTWHFVAHMQCHMDQKDMDGILSWNYRCVQWLYCSVACYCYCHIPKFMDSIRYSFGYLHCFINRLNMILHTFPIGWVGWNKSYILHYLHILMRWCKDSTNSFDTYDLVNGRFVVFFVCHQLYMTHSYT